MQLTGVLYRNSWLFFAIFFALVIWGFWRTYYSNPLQITYATLHVHGLLMTLWCGMLVAQGFLIFANRRDLHRILGKSSYVVAPLVFVSLIVILRVGLPVRFDIPATGVISDTNYFTFTFALLGAMFFGLFYLLAIRNRHKPETHGRLMLCTVFPIATAGIDRAISNYFPEFTSRLQALPGEAATQLVTWVGVDLILITLSIVDLQSKRKVYVFPAVLISMIAYQIFSTLAPYLGPWRAFCNWFLGA